MVKGPFGFPAEEFLLDVPPNYPLERVILSIKLVVTFIFFLVLPILLARRVSAPSQNEEEKEISTGESIATKKNANAKKSKGKSKGKPKPVEESSQEIKVVLEVHPLANLFAAVGAVVAMTYLLVMTSPDNYYTTNAVFQAPLLTREECQYVLQMADDVAASNFAAASEIQASSALKGGEANNTIQLLLQEPKGWNKLRHQEYPTTDLNLVTDPFTKEHRAWLKEKMDSRLAPLIQRIWGVPSGSIRASDMFVVRYDERKQTHLVNHTDTAQISINILLDDEFEGGGTRFWNRATQEPFAHVQPTQVGQVLMHSALLNHEGMHVEKGRRTIFVGFLDVDRVNPFVEGTPVTGISWYASWGSLFWLANKFKQGYHAAHHRLNFRQDHWRNNKYIRSFMGTAKMYLNEFTDAYFEHKVHNLVADNDSDAFILAMDEGYTGNGEASWFEGQQVDVDITGNIIFEWTSRSGNSHRFSEL